MAAILDGAPIHVRGVCSALEAAAGIKDRQEKQQPICQLCGAGQEEDRRPQNVCWPQAPEPACDQRCLPTTSHRGFHGCPERGKVLHHHGSSICLLPGRGSRKGQREDCILHSCWSLQVQQDVIWVFKRSCHIPEANAAGVAGRTFLGSPGLSGRLTSLFPDGGGTHWPVGESLW